LPQGTKGDRLNFIRVVDVLANASDTIQHVQVRNDLPIDGEIIRINLTRVVDVIAAHVQIAGHGTRAIAT
jgi:hypothetical protein